MSGKTTNFTNLAWETAAIIMALAGFIARCLPWRYIFSAGTVVMPGVDPYYHLWRAQHLVQTFPFAPLVDPFLSFPKGGPIPWPPGFDLMIALPGLFGASASSLATWGAVLMPVLGGLGVWLTWRFGKAVFDRLTGLVAAAFAAFSVGFIHYSKIGRIDHHALVAPMCLAISIFFLHALKHQKRSEVWSLLGATFAALALGSWIVTPPIYFIPVALMVIVQALQSRREQSPTVVRWGLISTVGLAALVVLWAGDPKNHFCLYRPSILHLLAYASLALLGLAALKGKRWLAATVTGLLIFAGFALLIFPQLSAPIYTAYEVGLGNSTAYSMAQESSPLFFPKHTLSLMRPVLLYSYLAYFWPLFIGALAMHIKKQQDPSPGKILILLWSTMGLVLMLAQERFGEYAAPALFLLTAWALVAGLRLARQALIHTSRLRRWVLGVSLGIALLIALWPIPKGLTFIYTHDPVKYQRQLCKFGVDLRNTLPSPLDSKQQAAWGLLTGWMDAHPLLEIAALPVAVSSFGTTRALDGNEQAFSLLLSEDEDFVYKKMEQMHLAYMVVSNQINQAQSMALIAKLPEKVVEITSGIDSRGRFFKLTRPLARYLKSVSTSLWLGDSSGQWSDGSIHKGFEHFRLLLESSASIRVPGTVNVKNAVLKAFQAVPGAHIAGTAKPGSEVRLRLSVQTNTERLFTYSRKTTSDKEGKFNFIVPYSTHDGTFPCKAQGPYRIKTHDSLVHLEVSEQDVLAGKTLDVTP